MRIEHKYDAAMRRLSMKNPDDGLTTYTHDAKGRLIRQWDPQDKTTTFTYDAIDRKTRVVLTTSSRTTNVSGWLAGLQTRVCA